MNKEAVNSQIANLTNQGKQLEIQLHMINGALGDCQYWLKQLEMEDAAKEVSQPESV